MPAELAAAARTVRSAFAERFGRPPDGIWAAPARVNLIGEHTDYNDGFVLPLAIDRRVTLAAALRPGGVLRLVSLERGEQELRLAEVRPGTVDGWAAYVAGAVWSLALEGAEVGGLDLLLTSDVPVGSGLSSSAAVECATLLAARDLYSGPEDRVRLALVAQRAENEVVGVPCGIMDQMASMACTANHVLLLDCRSLAAEQVPLTLHSAGLVLLVVDTRVAHALVGGAYAERRRACEQAAQILGVAALRDATEASLEAASERLGDVRYRRARHVVQENARVLAVAELLRRGRPELAGPALNASHASLRDDYQVSAAELDTAVDAALAAGALGARMTGAGFGGCALALAPADAAEEVTAAVTAAFADRGFRPPGVFRVHPADGASRLA
ncbi:MAG TPA: galactokinase [Actinomycetes bacterium]|jgi:galactokinase|nr:galactokinase [Actinomycetes bacterium]